MIEILVVAEKRSRKVEKLIRPRVLGRKCIARNEDGEFVCDKPATHRGRCFGCYRKFHNKKSSLATKKQRLEYDAKAVALGHVLTVYERIADVSDDPLDRLAAEVAT